MPPTITNITHHTPAGDLPVVGNILAEDLIKIAGVGFAPNALVRAGELTMSPILTKRGSSTSTEIEVLLPSVEAMETSTSYQRNAIVTNLTITVENPGEPAPTNVSEPWIIPILLGPPQISSPVVLKAQEVMLGTIVAGAAAAAVDDLGGPGGPGVDDAFGQVWFYPRVPPLPPLTPPTRLPGGHHSVTLPSALASTLAHIRKSGTRLKVASGHWHDDSLTAELPKRPFDGFIIVWRDDIPSRPLHIVSLLPPGVTCAQVQDVLGKMFKLNPDPAAPVVLHLGESLPLGVTSLPTGGLNPVIVNLLGSLTIQFAFKVTGLAPDKMRASGPNIGAIPTPSSLKTGSLMVCPDVYPDESKAPPSPQAFAVQLLVSVFLADCGTIQAAGSLLQCQQLPLGVPTIAVFFEDVHFDGAPMIVLPHDTNVIARGQHLDDNHSPEQLSGTWHTIRTALSSLAFTFEFLSTFAGVASIPGAEEISLISQLVDKVNAAGHLVIDSTGKMDHLEDAVVEGFWWRPDDDFDDAASSMIMVGSSGFGDLRGFRIDSFADENEGGQKVPWSLPSNKIIAAAPDFTHMNTAHDVNGTLIALPYGGGSAPTNDFNDEMGSLVVVSQ
jgi:hypothetical protein